MKALDILLLLVENKRPREPAEYLKVGQRPGSLRT